MFLFFLFFFFPLSSFSVSIYFSPETQGWWWQLRRQGAKLGRNSQLVLLQAAGDGDVAPGGTPLPTPPWPMGKLGLLLAEVWVMMGPHGAVAL